MKHLWTTAAVVALLALAATGADAAPEKKSQAEVAKTLRAAGKKPADKKKPAATEPTKKKAAEAQATKKKTADASPASTTRGKKAEGETVPTKGPVAKGPIKTEAPAPVTVGRGGTLAEVAKKAGVDRQTLIELNKLKPPYALKAGQKLKLPERRYYSVQSGDTLYAVSRRFKVPAAELAAFNDTDLKKRVQIGERIYIPDGAAGAPKPEKPTKLAAATPPKPKPVKPSTAEAAAATGATTRSASAPPKPAPAAAPEAAPPRLAMAKPPIQAPIQAPIMAPPPAATPSPSPAPALAPPAPAPVLDPAVGLEPSASAPTPTPPPSAAAPHTPTTAGPPAQGATTISPPAPVAGEPAPASATTPAQGQAQATAVGQPPPRRTTRVVTAAPLPPPATPAAPAPAQVAAASRQPPAMLRAPTPQYATPQPAPRSTFEMAPARPPAGQTPPPGGVPYAVLNQTSPRPSGGRGRPAALPPSIAREAPSSQPPIVVASAPVTQADVVAAGRGRFIWPVRGEILSGFGPKSGAPRNDGLNIAARIGEQVRAAASGQVVYAGDQVPTFGNLVLLKHPNGWVTAYAHLQGITVKNNDMVAQGQPIGMAGTSGNVGQTQLHFEMRYAPNPREKAAPIDPMLVLPAG